MRKQRLRIESKRKGMRRSGRGLTWGDEETPLGSEKDCVVIQTPFGPESPATKASGLLEQLLLLWHQQNCFWNAEAKEESPHPRQDTQFWRNQRLRMVAWEHYSEDTSPNDFCRPGSDLELLKFLKACNTTDSLPLPHTHHSAAKGLTIQGGGNNLWCITFKCFSDESTVTGR